MKEITGVSNSSQEITRVSWRLLEYPTRVCKRLLEYPTILKRLLEYPKVCERLQEYVSGEIYKDIT